MGIKIAHSFKRQLVASRNGHIKAMALNLQNMGFAQNHHSTNGGAESCFLIRINDLDKGSPSWEGVSSHLWSLRDMLEIHADHYIEIGRSLQSIIGFISATISPEDQLSDEHINSVRQTLRNLVEYHLDPLNLRVSIEIILGTFENYLKESKPTWGEVSKEIDSISKVINAELKSRLFFYILPHRVSYFIGENLITEDTLNKFPNVKWDMEEAGKCFATERFTAAVHHLMRVAEYGLVAFADFWEIPNKERANWNTALNQIDKILKDRTHPNFSGMTKQDEQYYSEASAWLRSIKNAWRNPSSHIPTIYLEEQTKDLFTFVKSLMSHLAKRFKEVPLTSSPVHFYGPY